MVDETTVNATIALNDKKAKKKRKKLGCKQDKDLALKKQRKKEKRKEKQKNEKSSTNIKNKSTSTLPTNKTKDIQTNAPAKQIAFETTKAASTKKKAQAKPNGKSTLEQTAKTISKAKAPAPKKTSDVPPTIPQLQSSKHPSDIRTESIGTANRAIPRVDAAAQTDATSSGNPIDEALPTLLDLLLQKKVFQKEQYQRKLCHVEKEIQQITRLRDKERNSHVGAAWAAKSVVTSTETAKARAKFPASNVSIMNLQNSTDVSDDIIANTAKVNGEYSANADGNGYSNDLFGSNLSACTQPLSDSEDDMHEKIIISKATDREAYSTTMVKPQKNFGGKPRGEEKISSTKQRKDPPLSKQERRQKATEFSDFPHNTDYELAPEIYKLDPNESSIEEDSKDSDFELEA